MSANDNGVDPAWDRLGYPFQDDRFTEDGAAEDVTNLRGISGLLTHRGKRHTVPLGLLHISFNLNSSTRASSGVMVAHLIPTLCLIMALAASTVTWSFVCSTKR
jgi:hypothetical protein